MASAKTAGPDRMYYVCKLIGLFQDALCEELVVEAARIERLLSEMLRAEYPGRIFQFCELAIFVEPNTPPGKVEQIEMVRVAG